MSRYLTLLYGGMLFGVVIACAQEPSSLVLLPPAVGGDVKPSGDARIDLIGFSALTMPFPQEGGGVAAAGRKSPWIAAGLSFLVPGAGEFYAESYWKSAVFFAAEVTIWVLAYVYDKKGDRQTDFFQDYANAHWSVKQYAEYAEQSLHPPNGEYSWLIPENAGRPPWDQVNWAELNRMERDIASSTAPYYSHVLPPYNEQQYYELIGKYPQFNQGWDDANTTPGSFNYGDPLTPHFTYYADERGKANRYYERATTFVTLAIINHIASAVDAAFSASSYNSGLHAEAGMKTIPAGRGSKDVPVLTLRYGL